MLDIFSGLRLVVKRRNISIDNAIFRCHWFFTSTLLVSFSLIITARQYVGQPIECHSVDKLPDSLLNSFCWVQSTFTVPQSCNQQQVGFDVPYPCIDNTRGREVKMFAYYQWVGIVLFVQGLLFHLPYYLWKVWENGLIKAITGGLRIAVLSDQDRIKKRDIVVDYIHDHLGCHKRYALKYFLCEFICLLNLIGQLWATNKFFDGQFLRYGIDVMQYSSSTLSSQFGLNSKVSQSSSNFESNNATLSSIKPNIPFMTATSTNNKLANAHVPRTSVDPMTFIFPRMTKCTYYDFGSSGDVQKHDALCLLPLNIINEKIYIALWFWFLVLAILTLLVIIYRLFAIVSESVRCKGLISRCKLSNEMDIRVICKHCDVGDWFLFYMVAENLDPLIMREIVTSVADKIRAHLELKKALGVGEGFDPLSDPDCMYKYKLVTGDTVYRAGSFDDESLATAASTRRNSLAAMTNGNYAGNSNNNNDSMPLVKKMKKRLYSKRLWSMDVGPPEMRQQLFGTINQRQPPMNPDQQPRQSLSAQSSLSVENHGAYTDQQQQSSCSQVVSAPPISQMPLNCAPPADFAARLMARRGSLTRFGSADSGHSTANGSFVMEMQTISGSGSQLNLPVDLSKSASTTRRVSYDFQPRGPSGSQQQRQTPHPLLRQRKIGGPTHLHHSSMSSIREFLAPSPKDWPEVSGHQHNNNNSDNNSSINDNNIKPQESA